jgi:hypothetical protein
MAATKNTAEQTPAVVDPAEVRREAQKALAETIKNARKAYSTAVADAKVARDGLIAADSQRRDPVLVRAGQHHPGPLGQRLRSRPLTRQRLQRRALSIRQDQRDKFRARHKPSLKPAKSSKTQDTSPAQ